MPDQQLLPILQLKVVYNNFVKFLGPCGQQEIDGTGALHN